MRDRDRYRYPLLVALLLVLAWIRWTRAKGAPYHPSRHRVVRRMLELAGVRPGELVYDLGSGDGRVLVTAARDFDARAIGVEIDPLRWAWSRLAVAASGSSERVRVVRADLFDVDLGDADVVACYLTQAANDALEAKLIRELRPGARVVSNTYAFSRLTPVDEDRGLRVRVYEVPGVS